MAKKPKDSTASADKAAAKVPAPADPAKLKSLIQLLNILALLLAITAFTLQFFAVVTHAWKHQVTELQPLLSPPDGPAQAYVSSDTRVDQNYGLFTRGVKLYANNDQQLDIKASTLFPKLVNKNHGDLNQCLSQSSTLRGALLTCNKRLNSSDKCHCGRYPYWNAVIFFEVAALVLLGLVIVAAALLTTQFSDLLKLAGLALSFLAFVFLLVGLILVLSYLKRETNTIADTFPHIYSRWGNQASQRYQSVLHKAVRREAHETYRAYSLQPGQHPYNQTHFQQYSEKENAWVHLPYTSLATSDYAPRAQGAAQPSTTTPLPTRNDYGPLIYPPLVHKNTKACIGWSTVLSILAAILAIVVALILAYSWLTANKLKPKKEVVVKTTTTEIQPGPTTVVIEEQVPLTSTAAPSS